MCEKLKFYFFTMLIAAILYKFSISIMLNLFDVSISHYAGFNDGFRFKLHKISYENFMSFFVGEKFFYRNFFLNISYLVFFIVNFIIIQYLLLKNKYSYCKRLFFILLISALVPFAIFHVEIFSKHVGSDTLTIYSMAFFLLTPIFLLDNVEDINWKIMLFCLVSIFNTIIMSYNYFIIDNIYYLKSKAFYDRTYALTVRIADRIEQLDGFNYNNTQRIAIFGTLKNIKSEAMYDIIKNDRAFYAGQFVGYDPEEYQAAKKIVNYINQDLGIPVILDSEKRMDNIQKSNEYINMSVWPSLNSVKKIDGTIVVKLSDDISHYRE